MGRKVVEDDVEAEESASKENQSMSTVVWRPQTVRSREEEEALSFEWWC